MKYSKSVKVSALCFCVIYIEYSEIKTQKGIRDICKTSKVIWSIMETMLILANALRNFPNWFSASSKTKTRCPYCVKPHSFIADQFAVTLSQITLHKLHEYQFHYIHAWNTLILTFKSLIQILFPNNFGS